jgi:hypothetical protein
MLEHEGRGPSAPPGLEVDLTPDQVVRYAEAAAAADDPGAVMDAATDVFAAMAALARQGDRVAMAGAAVAVGDACLRLCVSPATSAGAADDKVRFLALMVGWAWPLEPVLGAVLEASWRAEVEAWGLG